jgi:hypothetical protein
MTQTLQYSFRLFGPNAGKTMRVNGHQFVDGNCRINGAPESMSFVLKVLGSYGAFAAGTPEYDEALTRETMQNGTSIVQEEAQRGAADPDVGDIQSDGGEPSEDAADDLSGNDDPQDGSEGARPDGDGYTDTGVPDFAESANLVAPSEPTQAGDQRILAAVNKLDPENDDHWTQAGLPKLSAVEEAYGKAGVTRKDIIAVAAGFTRETALTRLTSSL